MGSDRPVRGVLRSAEVDHVVPADLERAAEHIYGVDIRTGNAIEVIDKSNLPPAGQYVPPKTDYPAFFAAKWKKEYGVG